MAKGFCSVCKKQVGGLFDPHGYKCPSCKKLYCRTCSPERGLLVKNPHCPHCGVKLQR